MTLYGEVDRDSIFMSIFIITTPILSGCALMYCCWRRYKESRQRMYLSSYYTNAATVIQPCNAKTSTMSADVYYDDSTKRFII